MYILPQLKKNVSVSQKRVREWSVKDEALMTAKFMRTAVK